MTDDVDLREVRLPQGYAPYALAAAPDGALWVTLLSPAGLGRVEPAAGAVLAFQDATGGEYRPMQVTAAADGTIWYTRSDDHLGRLEPGGAHRLVELPAGAAPYGIGVAPDGDVWFTAPGINRVGRWTGDAVRWVDVPVPDAYPAMLTVAGDGVVWVALNAAGALLRVDDGGTEVVALPPGSAPVGVAAGAGGVWYADIAGGRAGRVHPDGRVEPVALPDPECRPHAVAADPDGGCWVTEWAAGRLARITADGVVAEEVALPGREPHGLVVAGSHVWVAMESGSLVAVRRAGQDPGETSPVS